MEQSGRVSPENLVFSGNAAMDRPEWLPEGWKVEIKTRKSGLSAGMKDKYYIDPVTQRKLRSKDEVLRYLTGKPINCTPQPGKRYIDMCNRNYSLSMINSAEWLPTGWITETKMRKTGMSVGRKDRYYIDLVTGCKLRSKDEVLRYLTGQPTKRTLQPGKRCIDMCTRNHSLSMKNSAEWLPIGWITEIKTRKNGPRAGDLEKCYIAPYTGCRFYSKKDVLCYHETGIIHRKSSNRQKMRSINTLSIDRHPCSIKRQGSANTGAMRCLFGNQSNLNSCGTTAELIDELHSEVKCSQLTEFVLNQCIKDREMCGSSLQTFELPNQMEENSIKDFQMPSLEVESEDRMPMEKPVLLDLEKKQQLEDGLPPKPKEKEPSDCGVPLEMEDLKDRISDKVVLLEFENWKQLDDGTPLEPRDEKPSANVIMSQELEDEASSENGLEKHKKGRAQFRSSKPRVKKGVILPSRASKRLAALKGKLASDLASPPSATYHANTPHVSDAEKEHPNDKPSLEEPMEDLENEKVFHKDPESPLVFPFGDSWPDPCIEFAFKTLTGAIPVLEDVSSIENYFQQHLGVAQTQSPGATDGLVQQQLLFQPANDSTGDKVSEPWAAM